MNSIIETISNTSKIVNRYEKEFYTRGENFNIFKILKLTTNEVRVHSSFLSELLNPKGSHGQGSIFLSKFIEINNIDFFDCKNAKLEIEKHIGRINYDKTEGGFIDILITDNRNNAIIIENKIFASDQENQLIRYRNYAIKNKLKYYLYYLTLEGVSPSEFSAGKVDSIFFKEISYTKTIKQWLSECINEANDKPRLKESIFQYIQIINSLTGQANNNKMKEEIVKLITANDSYLKAFFELEKFDIKEKIRKKVLKEFYKQINKICSNFNLKLVENENLGQDKESYFHLYPIEKTTQNYISIGFGNYRSYMLYGIFNDKKEYKPEDKTLAKSVLGEGVGYPNWLWLDEIKCPFDNWNNHEPWLEILKGESVDTYFGEIIKKLNEVLNEI